jgi:hypothetical protein
LISSQTPPMLNPRTAFHRVFAIIQIVLNFYQVERRYVSYGDANQD